jgi:hypothetical protein
MLLAVTHKIDGRSSKFLEPFETESMKEEPSRKGHPLGPLSLKHLLEIGQGTGILGLTEPEECLLANR